MPVTTEAERPLRRILQDIVGNLQDIVRLEIRLARAELKEEATSAARAMTLAAVGAVLAIYAGGLLLLAAVRALSAVLQPWLAALLVGIGVGVIAAICLRIGIDRVAGVEMKPERTIQNAREDGKWARDQTR